MMYSKRAIPLMVKSEYLVKGRREKIIQCSLNMITEKGYEHLTTRELAKKCDFSIGTLYEYISKKEDIIILICDSLYEKISHLLIGFFYKNSKDVRELKNLLLSFFLLINEMNKEISVLQQEAYKFDKETLAYVRKKESDTVSMLAKVLRQFSSAHRFPIEEKEMRLIATNIIMKAQQWVISGWQLQEHYTLEEYSKRQIEQILLEIKNTRRNERKSN